MATTKTETPASIIATGERAQQTQKAREERIANAEMEFSDGFVSSYCDDLAITRGREQKKIDENGGTAFFWRCELTDAETGELIAAKLIEGKYGTCWMLLNGNGDATGEFITAHPKREATMTRKGYRERITVFEAEAITDYRGSGSGMGSLHTVRTIIRPKERIEYTGYAGANREDAEGWIEADFGDGYLGWQERAFA